MSRTVLAAAALASLPLTATAQSNPDIAFTLRGGASIAPGYFGSSTYQLGPDAGFSLQYLNLGGLEFGSYESFDPKMGFSLRGSFRYVPERSAADFPELTGLNTIEKSVELGMGLAYRTEYMNAFALARYGVVGHGSWVGEAGIDAIMQPTSRLTLRAGPRVFFGDDQYAQTYFGVTPAEAGASTYAAYQPSGGALTAGVEVGATYMIDDNWGIDGAVSWSRFVGDARNSPIVQQGSADQWKVRVGLTRRFSINW